MMRLLQRLKGCWAGAEQEQQLQRQQQQQQRLE